MDRIVLAHRIMMGLVTVVLAAMSLPVTAMFLDTVVDSVPLLVVALLGAMAIGAGAGALLPKVGGSDASVTRGAQIGLVLGLGAAIVGDLVWFRVLTG